MRNAMFSRWSLATVLVSSVLVGAGCSGTKETSGWQTMTLIQTKPVLVEVADGDGIREHGEGMVFEAKLNDQSGKPVAQLLGHHTIVDTPGDDGIGDPSVEERITTLSIVIDNGDEIVAHGADVYPADQKIIKADVPQYRALIGGTGTYKGIRGQVKTTRNGDETYTHILEYELA